MKKNHKAERNERLCAYIQKICQHHIGIAKALNEIYACLQEEVGGVCDGRQTKE